MTINNQYARNYSFYQWREVHWFLRTRHTFLQIGTCACWAFCVLLEIYTRFHAILSFNAQINYLRILFCFVNRWWKDCIIDAYIFIFDDLLCDWRMSQTYRCFKERKTFGKCNFKYDSSYHLGIFDQYKIENTVPNQIVMCNIFWPRFWLLAARKRDSEGITKQYPDKIPVSVQFSRLENLRKSYY